MVESFIAKQNRYPVYGHGSKDVAFAVAVDCYSVFLETVILHLMQIRQRRLMVPMKWLYIRPRESAETMPFLVSGEGDLGVFQNTLT